MTRRFPPQGLHASLVFLLIVLFSILGNGAEASGTISGIVRDPSGKPLVGAAVTLTTDAIPPVAQHTTSGEKGDYQFAGLGFGDYYLVVELNGFAPSGPNSIHLSAEAAAAMVDFKLTPKPPDTPSNTSPSPLKFEAAGVRGLIDPGGYSAPANAAAASGLIHGVANLKRSGNLTGAPSPKDWPCALEPELKKAVDANPGVAEANQRLGLFYLAHDQSAKAIPFLDRARELDNNGYAASRNLAMAWIKNGQFDSARGLLTALAGRAGNTEDKPEFHRLLARANEGLGRFTVASQEYAIAAKNDASEESLFGIGYELILAGQPAAAGSAFQAGISQHPRSITLLIGGGTVEFLQGHAADAILLFLRAIDVDPANPRAYAFLSEASSFSSAEGETVRAHFKRFAELAPNNSEALYFYALSLMEERKNEAREKGSTVADLSIATLLKRAIHLNPNFAKAHFQLANLYESTGDSGQAISEYETTVRLAPNLADAHYRLAAAYRRTGQTDLAARETLQFHSQHEQHAPNHPGGEIGVEDLISVLNQVSGEISAQVQCPEISSAR